jgi:O-antigen ligase
MAPSSQPVSPRHRLAAFARSLSYVTFGLFLVLVLGANSIARSGGPLSWLPLWRLPAATGELDAVGIVSLLPLLSVGSWWFGRANRPPGTAWSWGPARIYIPVGLLGLLVGANLVAQCLDGLCPFGGLARVLLLLGLFAWVYLYVINERPALVPIVSGILLLQAAVAVGQFVLQRDLGLRFLGELVLDPEQSGVSVVMNEGARWLRGYGLTIHPNVAARTLVSGLMMLVVLRGEARGPWRWVWWLAAGGGLLGLLVTLSRWAWVCLALGLAIAAWPAVRSLARTGIDWRRSRALPVAVAFVAGLLFFGLLYGGTITGRLFGTESSIESRSIWERQRDLAIAVRLVAAEPLSGVGFGRYLAPARALDPWAELVHNVPLLLAAELGLLGFFGWLLLLVAPVARPGAFAGRAAQTGLWVAFWCLGLLYLQPHLFTELRSMLLAGLVAGLVALPSALESQQRSPPPVAGPSAVGYH